MHHATARWQSVWVDYDTATHCVLPIASTQDRHAASADPGTWTWWQHTPPRGRRAALRQASCNHTNVCIAQAGGSVVCMIAGHMHIIHRLLFQCATICIIHRSHKSHQDIKFGDASEVVRANREKITYDEFEYDTTSVRRIESSACVASISAVHAVAPHIHPSVIYVCVYSTPFGCVHCIHPTHRTDFPGGVIWWHDYKLAKRRGRLLCIYAIPAVRCIHASHHIVDCD